MKELIEIQKELKAPKGQYNKFGDYAYRSCEDIVEAVKPILTKTNCTLTITDEIVVFGHGMICTDYINVGTDKNPDWREIQIPVGERYFVKATATLTNGSGETVSTTAYAEQPAGRKGMDAAQVTGSSSSYARKYALNGLLAIDDAKDPDATNDHGKGDSGKSAGNGPSAAKAPRPRTVSDPAPQNAGTMPKNADSSEPEDKLAKTLDFLASYNIMRSDIELLFGVDMEKFSDVEYARLKTATIAVLKEKVPFAVAVGIAYGIPEESLSGALGVEASEWRQGDLELIGTWIKAMREQKLNFDDAVAEVGR